MRTRYAILAILIMGLMPISALAGQAWWASFNNICTDHTVTLKSIQVKAGATVIWEITDQTYFDTGSVKYWLAETDDAPTTVRFVYTWDDVPTDQTTGDLLLPVTKLRRDHPLAGEDDTCAVVMNCDLGEPVPVLSPVFVTAMIALLVGIGFITLRWRAARRVRAGV